MNARKRSIGLFAENDGSWIAGVLYLQTVQYAFGQLPISERPALHLLMPRKIDPDHFREFRLRIDSTQLYGVERGSFTNAVFRLLGQSGRIRRNQISSLKAAVQNAGVDLLFPCHRSLGTDFPIPWVGWIPDFQHRRVPQFFDQHECRKRDLSYQKLVDDADHVVVSSEDAHADLIRYYRATPDRVSVYRFCTAIDATWFEQDPKSIADRYSLPEKYLMFPSQFWKHKNHLNLFLAIAELKRSGISDIALVLTGKAYDYRHPKYADSLLEFVRANGLSNNIRHLGLIDRGSQIQLMRRAAAIVQPSYFEGWSMLVEDCRALGKPLLLSELPVHREQLPEHANYFDPDDPAKIASVIAENWQSLRPGPDLIQESGAANWSQSAALANASVLSSIFERSLNRRTK